MCAWLFLAPIGCGSSDDTGGGPGSGGGAGAAGAAGAAGMAGAGGSGGDFTDVYTTDLAPPTASTAPISVDPSVKFYQDVPYGSDPMTRFDIFVPQSATPTPLMIHIHGGGFTGGDKNNYGKEASGINQVLGKGVAYASLNYRLLADVDTIGVIKPLTDCKRALQFIRHHAATFNIDPTKVFLKGGSAGAGTSLWLAFADDMADPSSSDPVAQQSTRVAGAAALATQSTYDIVKWNTVVFAEYGLDFLDLAVKSGLGQRISSFYGMQSPDELETPTIQAYRAKVDMLALMTADDPPFFVHNEKSPAVLPVDTDGLFHHAYHARTLTEQADKVGLGYTAYIDALNVSDPSGKNEWDFGLEALGK